MRHDKSHDLTINTRRPKFEEGDYSDQAYNSDEARRELIRQRIAMMQDDKSLGNEISEVWERC